MRFTASTSAACCRVAKRLPIPGRRRKSACSRGTIIRTTDVSYIPYSPRVSDRLLQNQQGRDTRSGLKILSLLLYTLQIVAAAPAHAIELISHRANGCHFTENSLQAIRASWAVGVDAIELDVRVSKDGVAYLFHDEEVGNRPVSDLDYSDLQSLTGQERTPMLSDALGINAPHGYYLLDLKQIEPDSIPVLVSTVVKSGLSPDRLVFQSERLSILAALHRRLPDARYFLLERLNRRLPFFQRPGATRLLRTVPLDLVDGISLKSRRSINKPMVRALRRAGLAVLVWTVNDAQRAGYFEQLGVDGLITDVPAELSDVTKRKRQAIKACGGSSGKHQTQSRRQTLLNRAVSIPVVFTSS